MSWTIWCDDKLIYDPRLNDYKVVSAKLSQELSKADTLTFSIYPQHPNFGYLKKFKPTLIVKNGDTVKSRCRILDDEIGWENGKKITAEGPFAWLCDTVQRPFEFPQDEDHTTPADYFSFLLGRHNQQEPAARQIQVGTVTVTDPNSYIARSDTEYSSTQRLIKEGLLNTVGGYMIPRYSGDTVYMDYLADSTVLANQPVRFGLNLLTLKTVRKGKDICTAILPLGKRDEEADTRLTISDLPDSETDDICKDGDLVYSKTSEALYGARIVAVVSWDDVTVNTNLLAKASEELGKRRQMPSQVTLTAADLSAAGYDYNTFSLGTYVAVYDDYHSEEHGLLATYLVKKVVIDLLDPSKNTLTLGATTMGMTEGNQRAIEQAMQKVEANVTAETAKTVHEVEQRNTSAIEQSSETILLTVTESYYTKDQTDQMIGQVSTEIQQTAEGINIQFSSIAQDIDDVQAGADAKFAALQSYIQFSGGSITLGEVGNEITLKIENDRIGIYSNGVPITYWTAQDFVAPKTLRIPVGGRLILGDFAFIPRSNGSLDFTWVGV